MSATGAASPSQNPTGGWHDAGDTLKYLVTSETATADMLLAYELAQQSPDRKGAAQSSPFFAG